MKQNYKISIPVYKQILFYLGEYKDSEESFVVDNAITQQGIAQALVLRIEHVSKTVKRLIFDGYVSVSTCIIKGFPRKKKAYFLTAKGKEKLNSMLNKFNDQTLLIRNLSGDLLEARFFHLKKALDFNIKPLMIYKYSSISKKGIIDLKKIISEIEKIESNYELNEYYANWLLPLKKNLIISDDIPQVKNFFGRKGELNQINMWLGKKELYNFIIIQGMMGIGKTTLISKLIEDFKDYKHIFWHNIQKWDSVRSVLTNIIEFLKKMDKYHYNIYLNFNKPVDLGEILQDLKNKMNGLNALLIFDDFQKANEELRDFFAQLVEKFEKIDEVKFIILTRYDFPFYDQQKVLVRNSVAELELEGLDFENSMEILSRKHLPRSRYKEVYDITSGNPLLLEIFEPNGRIKRNIYKEIFSHFSKNERRVLEILSVYKTPVPFDALFIDKKIEPETIDNLVRKLIIKETSEGIYDSHEFIKDLFYKRLNSQTRCRYHERCAEFYLMEGKAIDFINAFYHYIESERYQKAVELGMNKKQKIINNGLSERFLSILEAFPEEPVPLPELVKIIMLKAELCFIISDWDKSLEYYHRVIEISSALNLEDIEAMALCKIGHILEEQNLLDDALEKFQNALEIARKLKDNKILAEAKRGLGRYHWRKCEYTAAQKYYREGLKALKNSDEFKLIGSINIDIGIVYIETGKNTRAINSFKRGLNDLEKTNYIFEIARAYNNLGTVYYSMNKFEESVEYFKKQLDIMIKMGDFKLIGYGLSNIGYCYGKLNQITEAEEHTKRAKKIYEKTKNENILFQILRTEGLIYQYYQKWNKAINSMYKSIAILEKLDVPLYLSQTLIDFGLMYKMKGDIAESKKYFKRAYSICLKNGLSIPEELKKELK